MKRHFRVIAGIFGLLHLMVAGLGPLVDARIEAREREFTAHFESERPHPCNAGHDDLFCQICRVISSSGNAASQPLVPSIAQSRPILVGEARESAESSFNLVSHGPRAPPVLSA